MITKNQIPSNFSSLPSKKVTYFYPKFLFDLALHITRTYSKHVSYIINNKVEYNLRRKLPRASFSSCQETSNCETFMGKIYFFMSPYASQISLCLMWSFMINICLSWIMLVTKCKHWFVYRKFSLKDVRTLTTHNNLRLQFIT